MSTFNIQSLCRKSKRFLKIIAICFLNWCHDLPSVARTTYVSNKFPWFQRCSSHWGSTVYAWTSSEDPDQTTQNIVSNQGLHCFGTHKSMLKPTNKCSQTSIARTLMARLPWLIRTRIWVPTIFFRKLKETNIYGNSLILSYNYMLNVHIRIASMRRF